MDSGLDQRAGCERKFQRHSDKRRGPKSPATLLHPRSTIISVSTSIPPEKNWDLVGIGKCPSCRLTECPRFGIRESLVNALIFPLCAWLVACAFCCDAAGEIVSVR